LWGIYLSALDIKVPKKDQENPTGQDSNALNTTDEMFSDVYRVDISSDEDEEIPNSPNTREWAYRSDIQQLKKFPSLLISPLFSYFAILVLRLPITLSDIYLYGFIFQT
jgi:DNA polymerase III delta prime subunit